MSRPKGSGRPCDALQARQRLVDARQFLEAAKLFDAPDVVATNAVHAAIAAADAITCHGLGERSNDGNHALAVELLRKVDASLATALKRLVAFDGPNSCSRRQKLGSRRSSGLPLFGGTASQALSGCWRSRPRATQASRKPCYTLKRNVGVPLIHAL